MRHFVDWIALLGFSGIVLAPGLAIFIGSGINCVTAILLGLSILIVMGLWYTSLKAGCTHFGHEDD